MLVLLKTEVWKLKRYHMVWAGVFLMLLSVLLTVFSTTAQDGTKATTAPIKCPFGIRAAMAMIGRTAI